MVLIKIDAESAPTYLQSCAAKPGQFVLHWSQRTPSSTSRITTPCNKIKIEKKCEISLKDTIKEILSVHCKHFIYQMAVKESEE